MSDKYTREDVIIWPDDPRLKEALNKACYAADAPLEALLNANADIEQRTLVDINTRALMPFKTFYKGIHRYYSAIIIKKEADNNDKYTCADIIKATRKYVPFDLSDPEIKKSLYGRWIIAKTGNEECEINRFNAFEEHKGIWMVNGMSAEYLFNNYTFDDGKPCGMEVWE